MKKYLFLSSAFLMTMAGANAADKIITSANTCTVDVLGVSDNNATANTIATWDLIDYTLDPGEYLNVTDTSVTETTCPAGSYCVGGGYTVETANNSIAQCPAGYPNSANGASADTQCYTTCTLASANIAHATAVSGNDYYGTGTDTCTPTGCEMGYHVESGGFELLEKTPLINADYLIDGTTRNYVAIEHDGTVRYEGLPEDTLNSIGTWAADLDYGIIYGRASCQPTPAMSPEDIHQNIFNWTEDIAEGVHSIEELKAYMEYLGLGQQQANKVIYLVTMWLEFFNKEEKGEEINIADVERVEKLSYALIMTEYNSNYDINSVGGGCYCQMDGFKPSDGEKNTVMSAPWVFYKDFGTDEFSYTQCARNCASYCGRNLGLDGNEYHRASVFGVLDATEKLATCAANTINIDWNPDNNGEHIKNMCTYEGAIEVPADPVKPGYTFMGWKLVE